MSVDPVEADPALLSDNSEIKTFTTSKFTYSNLRIFYRRHPKADELPKVPSPLPLLVFVHGLGGSVAQFHPLLTSLLPVASCLAIDLPGCGRSEFSETSWDAYTTAALAELLETIIESYRDKKAGQQVVLIGHSMGSALCAYLSSKDLPHTTKLADNIVGLVAICPVSGPPPEEKVRIFRMLLWIPGWIFNLWRMWDRRGGADSKSVLRFVGDNADAESRRLQHLFNCQSRTPVWRRMASGSLPVYKAGVPVGGLPTPEIWKGLEVPIFLVAGKADKVTPPTEAEKLASLFEAGPAVKAKLGSLADSTSSSTSSPGGDGIDVSEDAGVSDAKANALPGVLQTLVMPAPANHALLYMPMTVRILAGNVSDFLSTYVTGRLALSWQLQYLAKEGKWELKNLTKWKSVQPVSKPIGPVDKPVFVAMKTLREVDELHCPAEFVKNWGTRPSKGRHRISQVIHGIQDPPTDEEIAKFISLVDTIRDSRPDGETRDLIGVHCHYGFNRTGYFIVCYLVERCGFAVEDAMAAFATSRPNGIRHQHFRDKLCMKYGMLVRGAEQAS
ncbi:unnamed protein product [Parascedosporium putredinis]|uniref:Tyrosine specific protein phosphatases domain-containing protein n=1 Tax=Parascedosporium putredinis TaxID=1442378 RepID=A0A9P1HCD5_9PEZI|nr:unnamed protein product [Parascedosporium putredinis]CAI8002973.1 unnamed protein product [Parascedosporium putredinis]